MRSKWRFFMFLAVFVTATVLAFLLHAWAASPRFSSALTTSVGADGSPLALSILDEKPTVPIDMALRVLGDATGGFRAGLRISAAEPAIISIISTAQDQGSDLKRLGNSAIFSKAVALAPDASSIAKSWSYETVYSLPKSTVQEQGGDFVTNLPVFTESAAYAISASNHASSLLCEGPLSDFGFPLVPKGAWLSPRYENGVTCGEGGGPAASLHKPERLTESVVLSEVRNSLTNSRLDVDTPAGGTLIFDDFVWRSTGGVLAPYLRATAIDAEKARSKDDFLSGIAFATAAAALVAMTQEGRDKLFPRRSLLFWRKRTRAEVSDTDVVPEMRTQPMLAVATASSPSPTDLTGLDDEQAPSRAIVAQVSLTHEDVTSGVAIGLGLAALLALIRRLGRR